MNNSNPALPFEVSDPTKQRLQKEAIQAIKAFFNDECITDVVKHMNLVVTDAIALTDAENDPFHNHHETVRIVAMNSKIVNLLTQLSFRANYL